MCTQLMSQDMAEKKTKNKFNTLKQFYIPQQY